MNRQGRDELMTHEDVAIVLEDRLTRKTERELPSDQGSRAEITTQSRTPVHSVPSGGTATCSPLPRYHALRELHLRHDRVCCTR